MWPGIFYEFSVAQKEQQYLAKKAAGTINYLDYFLYSNLKKEKIIYNYLKRISFNLSREPTR